MNYDDIDKKFNVLKDLGIFEQVLKDREIAIANMVDFEKEYELGKLFGCEIFFGVKFRVKDELE